jgi:hypothetical protein
LDAVLAADHIDFLKDSLDRIFLSCLYGAVIHPQLTCAMEVICGTHGSVKLSALSKAVIMSELRYDAANLYKQDVGFLQ